MHALQMNVMRRNEDAMLAAVCNKKILLKKKVAIWIAEILLRTLRLQPQALLF